MCPIRTEQFACVCRHITGSITEYISKTLVTLVVCNLPFVQCASYTQHICRLYYTQTLSSFCLLDLLMDKWTKAIFHVNTIVREWSLLYYRPFSCFSFDLQFYSRLIMLLLSHCRFIFSIFILCFHYLSICSWLDFVLY